MNESVGVIPQAHIYMCVVSVYSLGGLIASHSECFLLLIKKKNNHRIDIKSDNKEGTPHTPDSFWCGDVAKGYRKRCMAGK